MFTKEQLMNNIRKNYDNIAYNADFEIRKRISSKLERCGIMHRIFSRKKSLSSILEKMDKKATDKYLPEGKKMQDIIGIRIVLYFADDIDICISILKSLFIVDNYEHDIPDKDTFRQQRINYVFKAPNDIDYISKETSDSCLIDDTFEVQIRSIFSEGWHEVEHDIRYKFQEDWEFEDSLYRRMNGILAVLEICDNDIISVSDKLAYQMYKKGNWEAMIRNKFRLRFSHEVIDEGLKNLIIENTEYRKMVYKFERDRLVEMFSKTALPINYTNVIYLVNLDLLKDKNIEELTPEVIVRKYNQFVKCCL